MVRVEDMVEGNYPYSTENEIKKLKKEKQYLGLAFMKETIDDYTFFSLNVNGEFGWMQLPRTYTEKHKMFRGNYYHCAWNTNGKELGFEFHGLTQEELNEIQKNREKIFKEINLNDGSEEDDY